MDVVILRELTEDIDIGYWQLILRDPSAPFKLASLKDTG
jgi:hypothetical protein